MELKLEDIELELEMSVLELEGKKLEMVQPTLELERTDMHVLMFVLVRNWEMVLRLRPLLSHHRAS
jgi:hypothetical protein